MRSTRARLEVRALARAGIAIATAAALSACGGNVASDSANDVEGGEGGGDGEAEFAVCPVDMPRLGTTCSDEAHGCVYFTGSRCEGAVVCTKGTWTSSSCVDARR
jgi:hypothetical protein